MSKVLFITGASSGIGLETARHARAAGYELALAARRTELLAEIAAELGADHVLPLTVDVTEETSLAAGVAATLERFGRIDAVFANAGIGGAPGGYREAPPQAWKDLLMVNVYGLALTVQATAKALAESRGHLVITSSMAGRRSLAGSMYSATKWAANCIGHGYRKEIAGTGVRVTLIEPGMTDTPFFDERKQGFLEAEDVARAVLFALDQPERAEIHEISLVPTNMTGDNLVP
ncbi:MAG: SDR family oxidoreductase [Pseudomonadota bacterium]